MSNPEHNKEVFEIQNSDINVSEIMEEIETSLRKRAIDKNEIERITKLKLSADSPAGHREFDPSLIAHLFEKGIAPPKFTNPRLWFIRGPLKWLIIQFTELYSLVDKKLSENRIKAFYSILHELILLKTKHQRLEKKFDELHRQLVELRVNNRPSVFQDTYFDNNKPLEVSFSKSNQRIVSLLQKEKQTLVLLPDWDNFLNLLKVNRISFFAVVQNQFQYEYMKEQITNQISKVNSILEFGDYSQYSNLVLHCNACLLPTWILEKLLFTWKEKAMSGTNCFLRFSNSAINYHSPFQENYLTRIDLERLLSYLKELGFKNIISHSVEKDELELITFILP